MTDLLLLATLDPYLIPVARTDFNGIMALITRVNRLLNGGFSPGEIGEPVDTNLEFRGLDLSSVLHNFRGIMAARDLSGLLHPEVRSKYRAFALGNVVGLSISNAPSRIIEKAISSCQHENFELWMKELLGEELIRQLFESYVGSDCIDPEHGSTLGLATLFTSYLCLILCDDAEYASFYEREQSLNLSQFDQTRILTGKSGGANFFSPFPNISVNPVFIAIRGTIERDHEVYDRVNSIVNTTLALGELYNLQSIVKELMEMIVISGPQIGNEVMKLARPRNPFNPLNLIRGYGIRALAKYQDLYGKTLDGPISNMRRFRTVSSHIVWELEGIPHYHEITEQLTRVHSYVSRINERNIVSAKADWFPDLEQDFYGAEGLFESLKEPITDLTRSVTNSLDQVRNTISLSIAVAALAWSIPLAILGPIVSPVLLGFLVPTFTRAETWVILVGVSMIIATGRLNGVPGYFARIKNCFMHVDDSSGAEIRKKTSIYILSIFGLALLLVGGGMLYGVKERLPILVILSAPIATLAISAINGLVHLIGRLVSRIRSMAE